MEEGIFVYNIRGLFWGGYEYVDKELKEDGT